MEKEFKIGAWYKNPMMEKHGITKAAYTKLYQVEPIYRYSNVDPQPAKFLTFDEYITPEGLHIKLKPGEFLRQSNERYEEEMEEVEFKKALIYSANKKFNL